jgi:hypothetical protein
MTASMTGEYDIPTRKPRQRPATKPSTFRLECDMIEHLICNNTEPWIAIVLAIWKRLLAQPLQQATSLRRSTAVKDDF